MTLFRYITVVLTAEVLGRVTSAPAPSWDSDSIATQPFTTNAADEIAIYNYWTPERLASIPRDPSVNGSHVVPEELGYLGQENSVQGAVSKTVGRLLYTTRNAEGETTDSSCTATLLQSHNQAVVATAAHCVVSSNLAPSVGPSSNVLWIPGYRERNDPYGNFTISAAIYSRHYTNDTDKGIENDRTFLVLNRDSQGRAAGESLGSGQRISFGSREPGDRYSLGYPRYVSSGPADLPQRGSLAFTGERLASCHGTARAWEYGHGYTGFRCVMGGGASGGPHLEDFDLQTGVGTVVAVNAINDVVVENEEKVDYMFGAALTDALAQEMFEMAQDTTVETLA